jgi:hypothetical protein
MTWGKGRSRRLPRGLSTSFRYAGNSAIDKRESWIVAGKSCIDDLESWIVAGKNCNDAELDLHR